MASDSISLVKRDRLVEIERKAAKLWEDEQVFKAEAGEGPPKPGEKFFSSFPMPYMNSYLHMGHAFSLSKADFACAYRRLRGANVLLPFAFHCSGNSIKDSVDRIALESREFGEGEEFGDEDEDGIPPEGLSKESEWEIMRSHGFDDYDIKEFKRPYRWFLYFPPAAVEDLRAYGLGCDWRRSFLTTYINPFFDAFVKWQMRKLKSMGKIVKGCGEYMIFSPRLGQPCPDHDRVPGGEGVEPLEYTLIKMQVVEPFPLKLAPLQGKRVFLAAATLRPEIMYGQTDVWVLPDGKYGAYEINETDFFILTERAAFNLAYQDLSKIHRQPSCLLELTGNDLIGLPLRSPLAVHTIIYALPRSNILINKGTGIVTSLPSDAPDEEVIAIIIKKTAHRVWRGNYIQWNPRSR
ncbi:unnamed protein product [Microthlaspi erraticum]|uniref:leucine--tRNA ligase n=1 Tax=Microthlaspi erraticum TaxID=1685480 RepID=A0A6D2JMY4_9BRAS|nr:unnamed protein product [Microthlaspi erraticum]